MARIKEDIISSFMEYGKFKPIMSMTKDSFKEMQQFFLMKIIVGYSDGITAYEIQKKYHFPRSNVIRHLCELENKKFVTIEEKIVDGRLNKSYILSSEGFSHLSSLKEVWKERFSMMEELAGNYFTEAEKIFYIEKIEKIKTTKGKLVFLKNMKSNIDIKVTKIEKRKELLTAISGQINRIIENIESRDHLENEDIEELFDMLPGDRGD